MCAEDKTLAPSLATASASVNQAAPPLRLHERLIQKFERDFLKRKWLLSLIVDSFLHNLFMRFNELISEYYRTEN